MKRTKLLQELLMLRFQEAYEGWQEKRFSQEKAARLLGVSDRTLIRILKALILNPRFSFTCMNNYKIPVFWWSSSIKNQEVVL